MTLPPVTCLLQVKILNYSVIQSEKESGNLYWQQNVNLFKVSQLVLDEGIQYDWQLHVMIFPRTLKGKSQPAIMLQSGYGTREKWVYNLYSLCFTLQSGLRDRALRVQITSTPLLNHTELLMHQLGIAAFSPQASPMQSEVVPRDPRRFLHLSREKGPCHIRLSRMLYQCQNRSDSSVKYFKSCLWKWAGF